MPRGAASDGRATPESITPPSAPARESEAAVIFTGLPARSESEGFDRADMRLPDGVNRLIEGRRLREPAHCRRALRRLARGMPLADRVQAVLYMGLPGEAGGEGRGEAPLRPREPLREASPRPGRAIMRTAPPPRTSGRATPSTPRACTSATGTIPPPE